jgi:hypothetical protein
MLDNMVFNPFDEIDDSELLSDIDPDNNFYNTQGFTDPKNCNYHPVQSINKSLNKFENNNFSLCHLNIRSMNKNHRNLKTLLMNLDIKMSIIAITESWLKPSNVDLFDLEGYQHEARTREQKSGGGISLFIDDAIKYKVREVLSINNHFIETLWIELDKSTIDSNNNLLVGVFYRRPGSDPTDFNNTLTEILTTVNAENKPS